ncbi:hypothetical protein NBRC111894_517 [Sporolactobacillus inulinus]|jgi:hypothetical protein|uniref:Uncharacterized protein n=1 Tax=Sporolactobacillus inulinus TaxID=2078 RepID=A0A4Y1Z7E9_9BACL|nr:hypothetical protein NBRC111894_517 [Sporolactobacillus inulinus]
MLNETEVEEWRSFFIRSKMSKNPSFRCETPQIPAWLRRLAVRLIF